MAVKWPMVDFHVPPYWYSGFSGCGAPPAPAPGSDSRVLRRPATEGQQGRHTKCQLRALWCCCVQRQRNSTSAGVSQTSHALTRAGLLWLAVAAFPARLAARRRAVLHRFEQVVTSSQHFSHCASGGVWVRGCGCLVWVRGCAA